MNIKTNGNFMGAYQERITNHNTCHIFGGITHTAEEIKNHNTFISNLFAQMNQENQNDIMEQVKDSYLKFVINNSDNEAVKTL